MTATAPSPALSSPSRTMREGEVVAQKFPANTLVCEVDGVKGWLYSISSELGDYYQFFAYHDGSLYQVALVHPKLEGQYSPHQLHVYQNGLLCMSNQMGMSDLESAYAKSVLWATGCSVFLRTGHFPFTKAS